MKREWKHQDWCQYPWCLKCGMSREYHEEGPMVSHGFVQAECACGVAKKPDPLSSDAPVEKENRYTIAEIRSKLKTLTMYGEDELPNWVMWRDLIELFPADRGEGAP